LRFEKESRTDAQKLARKLAFDDAKKKAQEFALLSERSLGKVLSINYLSFSLSALVEVQNLETLALKSQVESIVSVGNQEITFNLKVKFSLE
jgi:uncharacterized protein YggE